MINLPEKIGLIAGKGRFPALISEKIQKSSPNTKIVVAGFKGQTGGEIKKFADRIRYFELGSIGRMITYFRENGIEKAVMAGLVSHGKIFDNNIEFDETAAQVFGALKDQKADSILGGFTSKLAENGIEMLSVLDFVNEHLAVPGVMTAAAPTPFEKEDMAFGFNLAKEISRLDTGQTVVVKRKCVVAIESIEGTDRCILRGGSLAGAGAVIVKVAKLHQDLRFDLPVIGIRTIKILKKIKSKAIAVEAGKTCLIDIGEVIKTADNYGISIVGM